MRWIGDRGMRSLRLWGDNGGDGGNGFTGGTERTENERSFSHEGTKGVEAHEE